VDRFAITIYPYSLDPPDIVQLVVLVEFHDSTVLLPAVIVDGVAVNDVIAGAPAAAGLA
jgi:hypothetical protein